MIELEQIAKVIPLNGKMPIADILEKLKTLDNIEIGEYPETNGWQQDYWQEFTYENKPFLISGSMWYGNYSIGAN